jgi:hypothetical protein
MPHTATDPAAVREEQRRMHRLRVMVDLTAAIIRHRPLSREEAELAVENLREQVLALFPDKGHVFDLIYRPRFGRLIAERFGSGGKDTSS